MAFGRKSSLPNGEVFYLRIKSKDENDVEILPATFTISKKDDKGEWKRLEKTEQIVTGDLVRIDLGKGEYEGKEYKTVKVYLQDTVAEEVYVLDLRYNLLSRNLYNSLVNLTSYKGVSVSLYKVKGKKETNKDKEYSAIAVWQNDNLIKGKFKTEDMPKPEEVKNSKGVVIQRDYGDLDSFLEKHLEALKSSLDAAQKSEKQSVKSHEPVPATDDVEPPPANDENVPF